MAAYDPDQRRHILILSRKCIFDSSPEVTRELNEELKTLSQSYELYFISHKYHQDYSPSGTFCVRYLSRDKEVREFIKKEASDASVTVIICGAVDEDMLLAASTKSFLITALYWSPSWARDGDDKAGVIKYGVPAPSPSKLSAILNVVTNQSNWYYSCTFNDPVPVRIVSLCLANTKYGVSEDEKVMAEKFQAILKDGCQDEAVHKALYCHLMSAIAHDKDFMEVQDWAVAPSSTRMPNKVMVKLKEYVRCMMNGKKPEDIFIRHTETNKSRSDCREERQEPGYCQKHFQSIRVNEAYKGKLKNRVVCVFDDYLTNGNTFESLRNLLVACNVKKIIFVSIGKFLSWQNCNAYYQNSFKIEGDVYTGNYTATFSHRNEHYGRIDNSARRSLENLKELAAYLK